MSFLDKLSDAAKKTGEALGEALSDAGVIDPRRGSAELGSGGGELTGDTEGHAREDLPDVPLTIDEVRSITNIGFDSVHAARLEEWEGRIFTFSGGSDHRFFELRKAVPLEGVGGFDPEDTWDFLCNEVEPRIPVDGVSAGAFRSSDDVIFFRVGDLVMHTTGDLGEATATLTHQLAAKAAANAAQ